MGDKQYLYYLLKSELESIDSNLLLEKDSNEIGEEIVKVSSNYRFAEIIRQKGERKASLSIDIKRANIGVIFTDNISKIVAILVAVIEKSIQPEKIYSSDFGFILPKGVNKKLKGDELLRELIWLDIISDYQEEGDMGFSMLNIIKKLRASNIFSNLVPFRSIGRLCFARDFFLTKQGLPCIYCQNNIEHHGIIFISSYNGNQRVQVKFDDIEEEFNRITSNKIFTENS